MCSCLDIVRSQNSLLFIVFLNGLLRILCWFCGAILLICMMDCRFVLWTLLWLYKHILVILVTGRHSTTTKINHPKHTLINIPMILLSNTTIIPQSNSTLSSSYLLSFRYFPTDIINRCLIYIKLIFLYIIILWSGFV